MRNIPPLSADPSFEEFFLFMSKCSYTLDLVKGPARTWEDILDENIRSYEQRAGMPLDIPAAERAQWVAKLRQWEGQS